MAIAFKKTVVFFFLFSEVFATTLQKGRKNKKEKFSFSTVTRGNSRRGGSPLSISPTSASGQPSAINGSRIQTPQEAEESISVEELDSFDIFDGIGNKKAKIDHFLSFSTVPNVPIEILLGAIIERNIETIRNIISSGIDVNSLSNFTGKTPFMHAIMSEDREIVQLFLNTGKVDPNVIADDNTNVFILALENFGMDLFHSLLTLPIKLKAVQALKMIQSLVKSLYPYTRPLIAVMAASGQDDIIGTLAYMTKVAVETGDMDLLKFLHSNGIQLDYRFTGANLIHFAAVHDNIEILKYLVEDNSVHIDSVTEENQLTALSISYLNKNYEAFFYLLQKGARNGLPICIASAIVESNLTFLELFLSNYDNFECITIGRGCNMLTFAMEFNYIPALRSMLSSKKFDPKVADPAGRTIFDIQASKNPTFDLCSLFDESEV